MEHPFALSLLVLRLSLGRKVTGDGIVCLEHPFVLSLSKDERMRAQLRTNQPFVLSLSKDERIRA